MSGIATKLLTLSLNSAWQPIGYKIVKHAICDLCSLNENNRYNYTALDIQYDKDENGEWDFSSAVDMTPYTWEDWICLPVREFDLAIRSPSIEVRVPTVIIAKNFNRMPIKRPRLTKHNVYMRDGGICQYTGEKLSKNQGNIDHVIPISRGGKDTWTNMVFCDKLLNSQKGNKTPEEAGLELIRPPREPNCKPISSTISSRHPDWNHFLA